MVGIWRSEEDQRSCFVKVSHAEAILGRGDLWLIWRPLHTPLQFLRGCMFNDLATSTHRRFKLILGQVVSSQPLSARYPRLDSYVLDKNCSAAEVYDQQDLLSLFYLPLSRQALEELQDLIAKMALNPLTMEARKWSYCWGPKFSAAKYYKHLRGHLVPLPICKWIWKSACMMRINFFCLPAP